MRGLLQFTQKHNVFILNWEVIFLITKKLPVLPQAAPLLNIKLHEAIEISAATVGPDPLARLQLEAVPS